MKNILLLFSIFLFISDIKAQEPVVTFTATPSTICVGESVTFTNTVILKPTSWRWYFPGGAPSKDTNSVFPGNPHTAVKYNHPGTYYVTCVVENNYGSDSVTVQNCVVVNALPTAIIMPPSGGICDTSPKGKALDTVFFTLADTTIGNKYSWAPPTGLTCANCNDPGALPNKTTAYTLTVTGNNGCSINLLDTVTVGYIEAKITGKDTICKGEADTLIVSGGSVGGSNRNSKNPQTTYLWSNGNTTSTLTVSPSVTTTYSVAIVSGTDPCTSETEITIVVINCSSGVSEFSENGAVKVYPNPNNGSFTLSLSDVNTACNLDIYSVLGEKVYSEVLKQSQSNINLSVQPNGVYLYRVITQTGELVGGGKLVISR